jgi:NCAIR mutase (PurE)-related protein
MAESCMNGILFDHGRTARIGLPEAVLSEGKSREALFELMQNYGLNKTRPVLFTRLAPDVFFSFPEELQRQYHFHELSGVAFTATLPLRPKGSVAVVSAGTADARTAWEAAKTLEYLGIPHTVYEDNGVAGLWRLTSNLENVNSFDVVIVVAGLDAALASVMGGLTGKPIFAVPTSVGYGMARGGESALSSMLVSCAPGVGVLNIDNGYGAACAAARVITLLEQFNFEKV